MGDVVSTQIEGEGLDTTQSIIETAEQNGGKLPSLYHELNDPHPAQQGGIFPLRYGSYSPIGVFWRSLLTGNSDISHIYGNNGDEVFELADKFDSAHRVREKIRKDVDMFQDEVLSTIREAAVSNPKVQSELRHRRYGYLNTDYEFVLNPEISGAVEQLTDILLNGEGRKDSVIEVLQISMLDGTDEQKRNMLLYYFCHKMGVEVRIDTSDRSKGGIRGQKGNNGVITPRIKSSLNKAVERLTNSVTQINPFFKYAVTFNEAGLAYREVLHEACAAALMLAIHGGGVKNPKKELLNQPQNIIPILEVLAIIGSKHSKISRYFLE